MLKTFIKRHYSSWVAVASDRRCFKEFQKDNLGIITTEWSELELWEVWILYPFVLASANVPLLKHLKTLGHDMNKQPTDNEIPRSQLLSKPILQFSLSLVDEESYLDVFYAYKSVGGDFKLKNGSYVSPTDVLFVKGNEALRDESVSLIGWENLSIFSVVMCSDYEYLVKAVEGGVDIFEVYRGSNVLFNMIKFFAGVHYSIGPVNGLYRDYTEKAFDYLLSLGVPVNEVRHGDTLLNLAHGYKEEGLKSILLKHGGVGSEDSRYPLSTPSPHRWGKSNIFSKKS